MKTIIKYIIRLLIRIWSYIYPYNFSHRLNSYCNKLYTIWFRNFIGYMGDDSIVYRPCSLQGYNFSKISIGHNTIIQNNCVLGCWNPSEDNTDRPSIVIGDGCHIGRYNQITAYEGVIIGNNLLTGSYVLISDNNHGNFSKKDIKLPPAQRKLITKGKVVIGNNVWLGDKVTILAGAKIGDNVIVAANAVVVGEIPSNCLAGGIPAKKIKEL
ncbi:acyltransferase [Prevotella communis]|uniref:acyltransferase n=1 Tax=Prevotella communis TaxID=2913614 RepID=UPI001EDAF6E4|nr:acyltransferase [Prevotella communis]UKK59571.1 acyltransferase [Prevotella communis]